MKLLVLFFPAVLCFMMLTAIPFASAQCRDQLKETAEAVMHTEKSVAKMSRMHKVKNMLSKGEMQKLMKLIKEAKGALAVAEAQHGEAKSDSEFKTACNKAGVALAKTKEANKIHMKFMKN